MIHDDLSASAELAEIEGHEEPDMSWFLIAVTRAKAGGHRDVVILDYAPGWEDFAIEFHWEDTFATDAPVHLPPGAYRWTGFKIGTWDEDEALQLFGGVFTRDSADAQNTQSGERK